MMSHGRMMLQKTPDYNLITHQHKPAKQSLTRTENHDLRAISFYLLFFVKNYLFTGLAKGTNQVLISLTIRLESAIRLKELKDEGIVLN